MSQNWRAEDGPEIEPGQIWVIEQTTACRLSSLDRRALAGAEAVLYEPSLFPLLADLLPMGGYCEPLPPTARDAAPAISLRALKLASEGWSVAQLIEPCRQARERLRRAAEELAPIRMQLIAKPGTGRCRDWDGGLPDWPKLADGAAEAELLTLILGPRGAVSLATRYAFTGNGLAG